MLLHIGENRSIPLTQILFVLNERGISPATRAYVERAKRDRRYENCAGKPKSYVVASERGREVVHASMIASATLEKRWRDEILRRYLLEEAVLTVTGERLEELEPNGEF